MKRPTREKGELFIVVPAYNEDTSIRGVLNEIPKQMSYRGSTYDLTVIVVDDGSGDNTASEARASLANPVVVSHITNSGAGGATRTGIIAALRQKSVNFRGLVTMDADGQHALEDVLRVLRLVVDNKGSVMFIGDRLSDRKGMTGLKRMGNEVLSLSTRLVSLVNVRDSQSGLRGFTPQAAKEIFWIRNDYAFCSEMILRAKTLGIKIIDVPVKAVYSDYSRSKGQSNWNGIKILSGLISSRIRIWSDT